MSISLLICKTETIILHPVCVKIKWILKMCGTDFKDVATS